MIILITVCRSEIHGEGVGVKVSFSGTFMAFNVHRNMSQENVGHC